MKRGYQAGFTFIEVLVAMLIFVLAVVTAINIADGSVRATREAKEISTASWLLQSIMSDMESKLETDGIDKACEKKKEGKFDPPYEKYTWVAYCNEIDFKLSQAAAALAQNQKDGEESDENSKEDAIVKMILNVASEYVSKSLRELHVEVNWVQGKQKRNVAGTTHVVKYDQPVQLPSLTN